MKTQSAATVAALLLVAAAAVAVEGFVVVVPRSRSGAGATSRRRDALCQQPLPQRSKRRPSSSSSSSSLQMMGGGVEAVSPVLLAQLAGCAALVGTGKVLLKQEEEEGIEPAAPWCVVWNGLAGMLIDGRLKADPLGCLCTRCRAEGLELPEEVDLYRETWVRYFGYFNEVRRSCMLLLLREADDTRSMDGCMDGLVG